MDIYIIDTNGGNIENLTNDPAIDFDPAWFPDGTQIPFTSTRDGNFGIYTMDADDNNVTRIDMDISGATSPQ